MNKKILTLILCGVLTLPNIANNTVFADSVTTVTLGESLNEQQKKQILNFFGVEENEVDIRIITNKEEREYLEGIFPDDQIGRKTFSCAYIQPTAAGSGINIKTANLININPQILKSAIITLDASIKDLNVIGASVIPVSGTGCLVGVIKTLEAEGVEIDEDKKIIANEELKITVDLSDEIGQDKATGVINDIKTEIIKNNTKDTIQIAETINNVTNNYNINLSAQQTEDIQDLMEKIAKEDYNYNEIKDSLKDIKNSINESLKNLGEKVNNTTFFEKIGNWFDGITQWFKNILKKHEESIIENTNDEALGENAVISTTDDLSSIDSEIPEKQKENIFEKIWIWFIGLFNKSEDHLEIQEDNEQNNITEENNATEIENGNNDSFEIDESTIMGEEYKIEESFSEEESEIITDDVNEDGTEDIVEDTEQELIE